MFKPTSLATTLSLALLVALAPLSTDMYLPALPGMAVEFSANTGQMQLTLSLFLAGFAFAQVIYGPLSDRFGRKPVLLAGLSLFIISSVGCALSDNVYSLILFRFLQALGGSAGPVLGRAMVRDIHGPKTAGKVLSHIGSAMALAPAIAPIAGSFMTVYWGWPSIFWFLALFAIAGAALLHFKIAESAPEQFRHPKSIKTILSDYVTLLKDSKYLGYTLTCTFSYSGLMCFLSVSAFVVIEYFGVPVQSFGLIFAFVVGGYLSGTLIGGKLSDYMGHRKLVALGSIVGLVGGVTMLLLAEFYPVHVAIIIGPMMLFMVSVGLIMPHSMAGALANYPHMAGSASGLFGFFQMTIAGIVGVIVGHSYDGTPVTMSAMIALMGLLTLITYLLLIHRD